jgi:subtilase family serine protease
VKLGSERGIMRTSVFVVLFILLVATSLLVACSGETTTPTPTPTPTSTATPTPPLLPDLVVSDMLQEYVAEVGIYHVTFRVCNNGAGDAGASVAGIYIDGSLEATVDVGSLGAADCVDHTTVDTFTESSPLESDTVWVCADIDEDVGESDEGNNCK